MLETKIKHPQVSSKIFTNFKCNGHLKLKQHSFFFCFLLFVFENVLKVFYGEHILCSYER